MYWKGMGQGRYPGRKGTVGNLVMQSCSYSGKSEHGSAPLMKMLGQSYSLLRKSRLWAETEEKTADKHCSVHSAKHW